MTFDEFFLSRAGFPPHGWQARLAADDTCRDRLIRIPTGFGKTAGVTLAWLWNRVEQKNDAWPRRLAFCLPMRTLVEQTERAVAGWLEKTGLNPKERLHVLMGGLSPSDWHIEPEQEAVLIGTQDMLLSRALNRGYGAGRARWPMEHALLNVDCLWVMDEIQLMDVGLATSAQLQAFARQDEQAGHLPRPRRTWWMSATLQRDWLCRAPDLPAVDELPMVKLEASEKTGALWSVEKSIRLEHLPAADDDKAERWAELVIGVHARSDRGVTLVVANTVKSAVALHKGLEKRKKSESLPADLNLRLVHSRFRGTERRQWAADFLARQKCESGANRIIVATQVVEAGVDISANALVTELAPWASLVQRFGRCARYGGTGEVVIVDRRHTDGSAQRIGAKTNDERDQKRRDADRSITLPYAVPEVEAATEALAGLIGVGPAPLESLEERRQDLLPRLYPYAPLHVIARRELRDLFDTGPDLTGADIDISRFVREGDERDVTVWWWPIPKDEPRPPLRLRPAHDALCRVPIGDARAWLVASSAKKGGDAEPMSEEASEDAKKTPVRRAWVWSYLGGEWERLEGRHVFPGQTILVDASVGGYDVRVGFTAKAGAIPVVPQHARLVDAVDAADEADEQDELSEGVAGRDRQYKTIATHGAETAVKARDVATTLGLGEPTASLLELAGLAHDIGKAHPAFAGAIKDRNGIAAETPLAKAPKGRWHGVRTMYNYSSLGKRPGFRHELASALALLELAWRARPDHPALQGGREELLDLTVGRDLPRDEERIHSRQGLVARLIALDATAFDLVAYVVMCHHGKVRATLPMSPRDQEHPGPRGDLPIRGVRHGDSLPAVVLPDGQGGDEELPPVTLSLEPARLGLSRRYGPSWVERVLGLRQQYGDFQLTWLETLLRVADVRASQIDQPRDPRLAVDLVEVAAGTGETKGDRDGDLRRWIEATLQAAAKEQRARPPEVTRGRSTVKGTGSPGRRKAGSRRSDGGEL